MITVCLSDPGMHTREVDCDNMAGAMLLLLQHNKNYTHAIFKEGGVTIATAQRELGQDGWKLNPTKRDVIHTCSYEGCDQRSTVTFTDYDSDGRHVVNADHMCSFHALVSLLGAANVQHEGDYITRALVEAGVRTA